MSRVLVTGGVGTIGSAVVRRLLRDPDFDVRVSDQRPAPVWMREGCEVHTGDLRSLREEHLDSCPAPRSAYGFSKLTGEVYCRAAHSEHGLPFTICRPFNAYGPGEMPEDEPGIAHAVPDLIRKSLQRLRPLPIFGSGEHTRTLTHVDDIADGIVTAMAHPAGLDEDFNISASEELTVAEIAAICWKAAGNDPADLAFEHLPTFEVDVQRRWPSVEKAKRLLGWEARIGAREGIADTVRWLREQRGAAVS